MHAGQALKSLTSLAVVSALLGSVPSTAPFDTELAGPGITTGGSWLAAAKGADVHWTLRALTSVTGSSSLLALRWGDIQATQPHLLPASSSRSGFVVLQAWEYPRIAEIRATQPGVKILVYKNMTATYDYASHDGVDDALLPAGVGYAWARLHHPDWFLRDAAGAALQWSDYPGLWPMDVANVDYQLQWLSNVAAESLGNGWDGVMVDDALTRVSHFTVGGATAWPTVTDQSQFKATRAFLAKVGPGLQARRLLVVPNASVTWSNYSDVYTGWAPYVDGWLFEYWAKWGPDSSYPVFLGADVQLRLQMLETVQSTSKFLLPVTYAGRDDIPTQVYHRALFLLGWDGGESSSIFSTSETSTSQVLPAAQADLGAPAGPRYVLPGGVLRRDFSGGTVLLNPTGSAIEVRLEPGLSTSGGALPHRVSLGQASAMLIMTVVPAARRA